MAWTSPMRSVNSPSSELSPATHDDKLQLLAPGLFC
jgi:hypothetical protein